MEIVPRPTAVTASAKEDDASPVVGDDGTVRWFRKDGTPLSGPPERAPSWRPYDRHAADEVAQRVAAGATVDKALEDSGVPRSCYVRWRRDRPEFEAMIEGARRLRSEGRHEAFLDEMDATPVSPEVPLSMGDMTEKELKGVKLRNSIRKEGLTLLEKKQTILSRFLKEDAPNRFGVDKRVTEVTGQTGLKMDINLSDDLQKFIRERFTPSLGSDGSLDVKGLEGHGSRKESVQDG